jgi:hypothetical protein
MRERGISVLRFSKKQSQSLYKLKFHTWSWLHDTQKIDENRSFLGPFPCRISLKTLPSLSYSFLPSISNIAIKRTIWMNIFPKVNCYKENIVKNVIWDVFTSKTWWDRKNYHYEENIGKNVIWDVFTSKTWWDRKNYHYEENIIIWDIAIKKTDLLGFFLENYV